MKLKDIPAPVYYLGGAAIAAVVIYRLVKSGAAAVGNAVNPVNPNNAAATAVNAVGAALSGKDDWTLGTWLGDLVHDDADNAAITASVTKTSTPISNAPDGAHRAKLAAKGIDNK